MKILYYSHDAQGNVMAIYTLTDPKGPNQAFTVDEHLLYGSSRLGVRKNGTELLTYVPSADPVKHPRGLKRYELSNHLGNVQAVVSDRRNRVCEGGSFVYYEADIRNMYDYYPFGSALERRTFVEAENYRFGFGGQLKDNEIYGDGNAYAFEYRIHDPRIGRFLSVDPLTKTYPFWTPYAFAGNTPIQAKDLEGAETFYTQYLENTGDNMVRVQARQDINQTPILAASMAGGGVLSLGLSAAPIATLAYLGQEIAEELAGVPILPDPGDLAQMQVKSIIKSRTAVNEVPEVLEAAAKPIQKANTPVNESNLGKFVSKTDKVAAKSSYKSLSELGLKDGMEVAPGKALELGEQFLGKGYKEMGAGTGRYVSADGTRVVRIGNSDITGAHGGGPHINFETLTPNPDKPGKMMVNENLHIYLKE